METIETIRIEQHTIVEDAPARFDDRATLSIERKRRRDTRRELMLTHESVVVVAKTDIEAQTVGEPPPVLDVSRDLNVFTADGRIADIFNSLDDTAPVTENLDRPTQVRAGEARIGDIASDLHDVLPEEIRRRVGARGGHLETQAVAVELIEVVAAQPLRRQTRWRIALRADGDIERLHSHERFDEGAGKKRSLRDSEIPAFAIEIRRGIRRDECVQAEIVDLEGKVGEGRREVMLLRETKVELGKAVVTLEYPLVLASRDVVDA